MTDVLRPFTIPIKGLKNGLHEFDFEIDKAFFEAFEDSPIQDGAFEVHLDFDKRDNLFELTFDFDGSYPTECDRCLADIRLHIGDTQHLKVKLTHEPLEEDAEVVYLSLDADELNVAKYIYEFICLAMPMVKTYDCENDETPPCDFEMLKRLTVGNSAVVNKKDKVKIDPKNPFSDLQDLFNKN
jgi:uncharacterized protein